MACVDLHNMILEDECDDYVKVVEPNVDVQFRWGLSFVMFCQDIKVIENSNLDFKTLQWFDWTFVAIEK
jgi:hypothetical protein